MMFCLSGCRFSEWQPSVCLDKTQENKPIPFLAQTRSKMSKRLSRSEKGGKSGKDGLGSGNPRFSDYVKTTALEIFKNCIALAAPPPPRQQPLSKRAPTIPSIFNNPYRTYFNFSIIESSLCMFEPGGEDWGAATCCSGHDQPFHLAGGQLADLSAVFFWLCHGTNENSTTDKLSRAIN